MLLLQIWWLLCAPANAVAPIKPALTPSQLAAVNRVSANSLRGRLSFLASDLLEGRGTPSRGLDIAAEYIASEFRRAGLEPGGDDDYFQTAEMVRSQPGTKDFKLTVRDGSGEIALGPGDAGVSVFEKLDLTNTTIYKIDLTDKDAAKKVKADEVRDKVLILQSPRGDLPGAQGIFGVLTRSKPALVIMLGDDFDPSPSRLKSPGDAAEKMPAIFSVPRIALSDPRVEKFFAGLPVGLTSATASVHVSAPEEVPVKLHNVVGILRGSDPKLRDTCVLVTAHYDHLGMKPNGSGDRIYNGANDDGSGTVSVMELADALAAARVHPRRSIVFVTFFGEEKGELGSHYFGKHPVFPIAKNVADINLEQVGRTDSTEGAQIANASITGFTFSTVTDTLVRAGLLTGVKIYRHPKNSDAYFARSDNQSMADQGVPAHTLCVAFDYPDYHGLGDEWPKVDYDNMAKVDRAVAVALLMIANDPAEPKWNAKEPKAAKYLKAWNELHPAK